MRQKREDMRSRQRCDEVVVGKEYAFGVLAMFTKRGQPNLTSFADVPFERPSMPTSTAR